MEKATSSKLGLSKKTSLKSKKQIDLLFSQGYVFKAYPLLVKYLQKPEEAEDCHQFVFSVPKRNFKRAVDRNLLKRRIKEAYRLNQLDFSDKVGTHYLNIAFLYIGKKILPYKAIEQAMLLALDYLSKHYDKKKEEPN